MLGAKTEREAHGIGMFPPNNHITHDIGVFARGMYSDGQTEVYAYTSADRSAAFGLLGKGSAWSRPLDVAGIGMNLGWISKEHAEYLAMGGIDGFVGDGAITPGAEKFASMCFTASVFGSFCG